MCPAMTEDPIPPGRGLPVYHPATVLEVGTCRVCCAVMPSRISLLCTPMAGMVRDTGAGTAGAGDAFGAGAADPEGTRTAGRAARLAAALGWPVSMTRPAAPSASTTTPQTRMARANGRLRRRPGGGPPRG